MISNKVPYHARRFYNYNDVKGFHGSKQKFVSYDEDDNNNESIPIIETEREHKSSDTDEEDSDHPPKLLDHYESFCTAMIAERCVKESGWEIQDLKILRIWNISIIAKPPKVIFSVKCKSVSDKIELSIGEKDDYGSSLVKMRALDLNTQDCDKPLVVKVNDCEVSYSLFSNAVRIKLEMIPRYSDRRPVEVVHGHVIANLTTNSGGTYTKNLFFEQDGTHKRPKRIGDVPIASSILILPRDYRSFVLDVSLMDTFGKFEVKETVRVWCRRTCIDQQHYILGKEGHIILRAVWGCLCAEQEVCTCCFSGNVMGFEEPEISSTYDVEK